MRQSTMQGGASVLIILIMICLTTFGVLALISAYSDLKLARRNAEFMRDSYQLETEAEQQLEQLEQAIKPNSDARDFASLGWQVQAGEESRLYKDVSSGLRHINISIELDPDEEKGYRIISWKQNQDQFQYSAGEKLWDGQVIVD